MRRKDKTLTASISEDKDFYIGPDPINQAANKNVQKSVQLTVQEQVSDAVCHSVYYSAIIDLQEKFPDLHSW